MNLQCKLHLPSVLGGIRLAEERRRDDAHVVVEVGMVENIEGIDADNFGLSVQAATGASLLRVIATALQAWPN
jgi:hypothetical protein